MKLLRTVLYLDALLLAATGFLFGLVPAWLLERVFDQAPLDEYAWTRMAGILSVGMAMLMVMVAHRIETLWWFAWVFVLMEGTLALLCVLNVLFGLHDDSQPLLWWLLAGGSGAFAAALLVGLAKTGLERPAS